jgi:hypothetical protein
VKSYAVCLEVGGRAGHPEEQQREADQRAPGVHLQCGGVETTAPFLQGITLPYQRTAGVHLQCGGVETTAPFI